MKTKLALVGLAHPFEVGYDKAEALLNTTAAALTGEGVDCYTTWFCRWTLWPRRTARPI